MLNIDGSMSYYNDQTFKIFSQRRGGLCHNYITVAAYVKAQEQGKIEAGIDLKKCRRNMLRYANVDDWCVFSVMDSPVPFELKEHVGLPRGFYFIESKNICPLKGNGWYSVPMVRYCVRKGLIQYDQIKFVVRASMKLEPRYFHRWIDYLLKTFTDPRDEKLLKLMINGVVGIWGNRESKRREMRFFKVEQAANAEIFKRKQQEDTSFMVVPKFYSETTQERDEDGVITPDYYEVQWSSRFTRLENQVPLYWQVLDLEAIELHKAGLIISRAGGKVVHCNTDAMVGHFDSQKQIDNMYREAMDENGQKEFPNIAKFLLCQNVCMNVRKN